MDSAQSRSQGSAGRGYVDAYSRPNGAVVESRRHDARTQDTAAAHGKRVRCEMAHRGRWVQIWLARLGYEFCANRSGTLDGVLYGSCVGPARVSDRRTTSGLVGEIRGSAANSPELSVAQLPRRLESGSQAKESRVRDDLRQRISHVCLD